MLSAKPTDCFTVAERLNFLFTNRVPRQLLNRFIGWFSRIEQPLLCRLTLWLWQCCVDDLRLHEAARPRFTSLHDCFTRELQAGARPVDPDPTALTSPCDAVIGTFGAVADCTVIQAKGFPYRLDELTGSPSLAEPYRHGRFITLRLKSSMYHRFHAPCAAELKAIHHIAGDTWNVNPVAVRRIERLYCRNTRAVLELDASGTPLAMVAIAAILVASLRFRGIDLALPSTYRGPARFPCRRQLAKGDEIGHFEHGSTIVLLTTAAFQFCDHLETGAIIRMGEPLLQRTDAVTTTAPKN